MMPPEAQAVLERCAAPVSSDLPRPHALLVFAHSDDEVIAVGGRMERYRDSRFICVTDGTLPGIGPARGYPSDEDWRLMRRKERLHAFGLADLDLRQAHPAGLEALDGRIVDQQACNHLVSLTRELKAAIEKFQPEVVLTHPYEGGHPDHDSCAFAVHRAVRLLALESRPPIVETPSYYYQGKCVWGSFLNESDWPLEKKALEAAEQKNKTSRLNCFGSQSDTLKNVSRSEEKYRIAPPYDFTEPPHPDFSDYSCVGSKLTGADFLRLVGEASR